MYATKWSRGAPLVPHPTLPDGDVDGGVEERGLVQRADAELGKEGGDVGPGPQPRAL